MHDSKNYYFPNSFLFVFWGTNDNKPVNFIGHYINLTLWSFGHPQSHFESIRNCINSMFALRTFHLLCMRWCLNNLLPCSHFLISWWYPRDQDYLWLLEKRRVWSKIRCTIIQHVLLSTQGTYSFHNIVKFIWIHFVFNFYETICSLLDTNMIVESSCWKICNTFLWYKECIGLSVPYERTYTNTFGNTGCPNSYTML